MGSWTRSVRAAGAIAVVLSLSACPAGGDAAPSAATTASDDEGVAVSTSATLTGAWLDATDEAIGPTADYTNGVELADLDLDGDVDLLFANGGDYTTPGEPAVSRVFLNRGDGTFEDATQDVLGETPALTRVIKVADLDADGGPDIVMGTTYDTQSRLLLADGSGGWVDSTATHLPAAGLSAGDLELGDVDADSDLDIVIADWGDGSPRGPGGRVVLWLNDGAAHFTDATADRMPQTLVRFSWDLEAVDVDNDWDLDLAVSCKLCPSSLLYVNDGAGRFDDVTSGRMPAFSNNYEFAPIDLDADGYLDLVTINDGAKSDAGPAEHVFRNDGGRFVDATADWWPTEANPGYDDAVVVGLDVESDGDADFLVGSLDGPERVLINDGTGLLTLAPDVVDAAPSQGTLGLALADLDGDDRPDLVEAQGEVPGHWAEHVYRATDVLEPDTAPPLVRAQIVDGVVVARVHDSRTPNRPHDWRSITARWTGDELPMTWYGENLFRADVPDDARAGQVCATDRAGNQACSDW